MRYCLVILFSLLSSWAFAQERWAIVVGISEYPTSSGWCNINGANDINLYQDSCVALYDNIRIGKLSALNLNVKLKTYLFKIGHNKLVDLYRRSDSKHRSRFIENIDYAKDYDSTYNDECSEREAIIRQAVNAMSEPCNSILTLYYWDDKSIKEITEIRNTTNPDATKMQKSRCMSKLKAYIKKLLE